MRSGMCVAAVGLSFRMYFILKGNFPLIFYVNAYLFDGIVYFLLLYSLVMNKYHYHIVTVLFTF
jgi:hypothetical protein